MQNTSSDATSAPYNPLSAAQRIRPDLLGFVFHLSWMYLLLYSDAVVSARGGVFVAASDPAYLTSAAALMVVLAFGIASTRQFMSICELTACAIAAPAAMAVGTAFYCMIQFQPSDVLMFAGGALTGIGSAMMAARWASVFGGASSRTVVENLPTLLAAIVVICASVRFLPREACLALVVFMPVLSGLTLQFARRYQRAMSQAAGGRASHRKGVRAQRAADLVFPKPLAKEGSKLPIVGEVVLVALMGLTISVLPVVATVGFDSSMLFYVVSGALVLAFTAIFIARFDRAGLFMLFIMPVLVIVVALVPLVGSGMRGVGPALQPVGNIAFELVLLHGTVLLARLIDESPARMFMIGRLTLTVFDLLGAYLGGVLLASADSEMVAQAAGILLFCACELVLVALIVAFLTTSRVVDVTGGVRDAQPAGVDDAGEAVAPGRDVAGESAVPAVSVSVVAPVAPAVAAESIEPASAASAPSQAPAPVPFEPAAPEADRAELAADRFGLSARERDVLRLLAEGRSSARIQEELCIAAGTVNYHTRNIYSKMGVHSRQELIDLVQAQETESIAPAV